MMISTDSLENINEEDEGTYRIGLPQPHSVENESEFMTNSGRSLKKTQANIPHNHEPYRDSLNEDDYSNHKTRVIPHRGDGGSNKQFEMTKSIQAQLHLSLDRLSEASYDQSNVKKQKLNTPKTMPAVKKSFSPTHAQTNGLYVTESRQSSQVDSAASKNGERHQSPVISGNLSTVKDSLSLSHKATGAVRFSADFDDDASDNDDIRTVAVDDSLDDESLVGLDSASPLRKVRDSNQPDPYAHLRYDPEWRNTMEKDKKQTTNHGRQESEPPMVIDFRGAPRLPATPDLESGEAVYAQEYKEMAQPSGGAITIHNTELSPARTDAAGEEHSGNNRSTSSQHTDGDSLVRHSTDSAHLENMNTLYEQEFRRMLELERHWNEQGVEPFSEELPPQFRAKDGDHREAPSAGGPGVHGAASPGSPGNHQPPAPYMDVRKPEKDSPVAQQHATRQVNHNQSPMAPASGYASDSALPPKHRRTLHMRAHVPTPPRAPKSDRDKDYIEMNKIRLGRKSNSASYLEMHSKLKKQQEAEERAAKEKQKQQKARPKTDDIVAKPQQQENPAEIFERIQRRVSDENLGEAEVEDVWIQQAQRLKEFKEAKLTGGSKSKSVQQRRTLREVGNTSEEARRPPFDPEDALLDKRRSPRKISPPRRAHDSLDHDLAVDENDFSAHPAFAPHQQYDPTRSSDHFVSPQHQQQLRQHARIAQLSGQPNTYPTYQGSEESPYSDADPYDASWGSGHSEQKYYYADAAGRAYQQQQQQYVPRGRQGYDEPAAKASPMMQAYRRRFERSPPSEERIMALPPKPENPLSPRNIADEFHYGNGASPRLRSSSDPSMGKRSNSYLKKRVNFDPVLYGPPSPQSRIPLPVGQYNVYRYPVPLPPTNGAMPPGAFVQTRYEQSSQETQYIWSTTHPGDVAPARVPLLPPIMGTSSDTSGYHVTHQQHVPSPRPSDDDRGSYLQQRVKQIQKPGYKKYTLEDYKNLKRDLNLGGLGPDLISAKQKMGKVERARKYAEFIRQQHKSSAAAASPKAGQDDDVIAEQQQRFVVGADSEEKRRERNEKRKRAMEYARQVPKPKAQQQQLRHQEQQSAQHDPRDHDEGLDLDMLRNLQERHEREKALVAGLSSTTNMT